MVNSKYQTRIRTSRSLTVLAGDRHFAQRRYDMALEIALDAISRFSLQTLLSRLIMVVSYISNADLVASYPAETHYFVVAALCIGLHPVPLEQRLTDCAEC
jgi:hypothetical protein